MAKEKNQEVFLRQKCTFDFTDWVTYYFPYLLYKSFVYGTYNEKKREETVYNKSIDDVVCPITV